MSSKIKKKNPGTQVPQIKRKKTIFYRDQKVNIFSSMVYKVSVVPAELGHYTANAQMRQIAHMIHQ